MAGTVIQDSSRRYGGNLSRNIKLLLACILSTSLFVSIIALKNYDGKNWNTSEFSMVLDFETPSVSTSSTKQIDKGNRTGSPNAIKAKPKEGSNIGESKNDASSEETKLDDDGYWYTTEDGRKRMNVLILYPDDWRHNSIGKENPIIQTPFLDSLADDGIRFRHNFVTTSICWISRASLFTGQWLSRHQSIRLRCPHFARGAAWNQTWPSMLQKDGYFVGHVGKWQFYSDNKKRFDWSKFYEGFHRYPLSHYPHYKNIAITADKNKEIPAEELAREDALRFLRQRPKHKPFALTTAFYPPKPVGISGEPGAQWTPKKEARAIYENMTIPEPYNMTHAFTLLPDFLQEPHTAAAAKFQERYSTETHYQEAMKNIYALITQVDDACKQIVDEIKRQGLYDNTMIIFTTDNGMFHGSHGLAGKWYPYQESIRVPLIIHDPRMSSAKKGTINDNLTLNVDLAETILGAAGLKPHEMMQGRDISDLYLPNKDTIDEKTAAEKSPWREEFFYEFSYPDSKTFIPSSNAVVQKKWKYIDWTGYNHEQLFNLENDPLEFTDVKYRMENSEILTSMRKSMAKYKKHFEDSRGEELPCTMINDAYWSVNPQTEKSV